MKEKTTKQKKKKYKMKIHDFKKIFYKRMKFCISNNVCTNMWRVQGLYVFFFIAVHMRRDRTECSSGLGWMDGLHLIFFIQFHFFSFIGQH